MHSYWVHLIHDPLTLKDLIAITLGISAAMVIMILVIGSIWAMIDFFREKGRELETRNHFKKLVSYDEVSK